MSFNTLNSSFPQVGHYSPVLSSNCDDSKRTLWLEVFIATVPALLTIAGQKIVEEISDHFKRQRAKEHAAKKKATHTDTSGPKSEPQILEGTDGRLYAVIDGVVYPEELEDGDLDDLGGEEEGHDEGIPPVATIIVDETPKKDRAAPPRRGGRRKLPSPPASKK